MKATRYVMQDGAEFYIHRDSGMLDLQQVWVAPFRVKDCDVEAAQKAKELLTRQLEVAGYVVEFPNPFDHQGA